MSTELRHWHREDDPQGITWLILDKADSRSNTLSADVLEELAKLLAGLTSAPPRGVIVRSGKNGSFIAGADIGEFKALVDPEQTYELVRQGQQVIDDLAALPCPTVAMIDGHALGGGLELALACDYRVCAEEDRGTLGLPEVQLGIHPGFGGTARSVRLLGAPAAMDLMLTGRMLRPARARAIGLVDRVVPREQLRRAAREFIQRRPPKRRPGLMLRVLGLPGLRAAVAWRLRREVSKRASEAHYPAPYALIDLWQRHGGHGRRAIDAEARSIATLFATPTCRNLVRVFFLRERMKSLAPKSTPAPQHLHVIGAGVMGGDIAAWAVTQGLEVSLQDQDTAAIERALARAGEQFDRRYRTEPGRADARRRLRADPEGHAVPEADIIIEAIVERLEVKRGLFADLERSARPDALLATNTSSLRLEDIAESLEQPGRLVGIHFFNPVSRLPLVEIVHGRDTQSAVLERALAFTVAIGKLPLPCSSQPGFLVNRILAPYMAEAMSLHEEGVPLAVIDAAARSFGMPMGPVELADSVGLDVALHVAEILGAALGRSPPAALREKVEAGDLGRKTGRGFYRYRDGRKVDDPGRATVAGASEDLEDRLILPMVNEAVACHADGVVDDLELLDAGVIFGTGFAPFRGGPIQYARSRGLAATRARLEALAGRYGERFRPHPGWSALIDADASPGET